MIPRCSESNSILDAELRSRAATGEIHKLTLVTTKDGSYAVAYLADEPRKPVYLATRRDRSNPKIYIDIGRLVTSLADLAAVGVPMAIQAHHIYPAKST